MCWVGLGWVRFGNVLGWVGLGSGMCWVGLGYVRECAGLGWVGLGWVGWVGLGWVGLGWVGLVFYLFRTNRFVLMRTTGFVCLLFDIESAYMGDLAGCTIPFQVLPALPSQ